MKRSLLPPFALALLFAALGLSLPVAAEDEPVEPVEAVETLPEVPHWLRTQTFESLGRGSDSLLMGVRNSDQIEFGLRRDRLASKVELDLQFTPSPALVPRLSHLRVYLNDELMGVVPIGEEDIGVQRQQRIPLDPKLVQDFNRVRVEFVGHYTDICEDPAHSSLWLNVSRKSRIIVDEQALVTDNDLAYFPLPYFDARDTARVSIPMVFAASPGLGEQKAAAIIASYFGSKAKWRMATFPVLYNRLPAQTDLQPVPSIVFATNDRRPDFLRDPEQFPPVDGPVIQQISHPDNRYGKVLLVLGRNEDDLIQAASALAVGTDLFRGSRVAVQKVQELKPRQPYDAPNWVRTDRPVRFAELLDYPGQLQVDGLSPAPIELALNVPPDLFVWRNQGVAVNTLYRYTPPVVTDESRLTISLNDHFVGSIALPGSDGLGAALQNLRSSLFSGDASTLSDKTLVPALKISDRNRLRYDFSFASKVGNAQNGQCQTYLPADVRAAIDENSTIDLSGYHHYIAMPDLSAFSRSAFPFSRMADLSQTLLLMPKAPDEMQLGTMLDLVAGMASRIGYPALGLQLSDDWTSAAKADADLLLLGPLPDALRSGRELNLLRASSGDWLRQARSPWPLDTSSSQRLREGDRSVPVSQVDVLARAPIAAITGMQSPFHDQRSIVALLATDAGDYQLLREALTDPGKLNDHINGSVSLIRSSGVSSHYVGDTYFVGNLPWWMMLWVQLSYHPVLLALGAVLSILLLGIVVWRLLAWVARRRLGED
ncbi:cellulose biosynthesis cyclic di-GMP-binding regulatory protein BcsB [Aquipseudomonas alcaligenes]|uniref:cellulose biosynthesis cyclic di-GMP-binding regulatory protein BcsB n=1 Tax=Aquipseudomonas alcaligenes TaxID=43263 RepID=UPI0037495BA4